MKEGSNSEVVFNQRGKELLKDVTACFPLPVLILGGTGWGKSVLCREAARDLKIPYDSINAHMGMDMNILVGLWRPRNSNNNIEVVWEDGLLTQTIRQGGAFFFEELTRAPREIVSRLHGILDTTGRYWSLPEAGQGNIEVSKSFWFISTANPPGDGYQAQAIEKALLSRFSAQFTVDGTIADEEQIVSRKVGKDLAERVMRTVVDSRRNDDTAICTRDLVLWTELISRGFLPERAFELSVLPKYPKQKGLKEIVNAHFSTATANRQRGKQRTTRHSR